jgi:hypothetical protein
VKKQVPKNVKGPLTFRQKLAGFRMIGDLIAIKVETVKVPFGDWRWVGAYERRRFAYYCPECGDRLTAGPTGGSAVNSVCNTCPVNYGCLPNSEWE